MSLRSANDALLPPDGAAASAVRVRLTAFVPIAVALIGVGVILLGGLSARDSDTITIGKADVDPVVTGSIAKPDKSPDEIRHILEMLDR